LPVAIYVGSEKAQVYALNSSDGSIAWQTTVAVNPCLSGGERGLVLIHTSNGQLQALNEADGLVKWTVNLDMPALSLLVIAALPLVLHGVAR
jgi:outer membrane protein assembly factor BamB